MKNSVALFTFLVAFVLVATYSNAVAAEEYELGEIVVSHDAPAESDVVSSLSVVTAQDIKDAGARTLNEAIDLLPGVYVRTGGDGTPRIDIRGMRTRNVVIMVDGIPFNSAYDYQFDPTLIPVENIARIKVIRGATSVLYGPNGNAGAINIITKKGAQGVHGYAGVEVADKDTLLMHGSVGFESGEVSGFVSGQSYDSEGFPLSGDFKETPFEDGGMRDNSDRERASLYGNFLYTPSEETQLGMSAMAYGASYDIPYLIYNDRTYGNQRFDRVDVDDGLALQVSGQHDFQGPLALRGWMYYNSMQETTNRFDDATMTTQNRRNSFHQEYNTSIWGAAMQPSLDLGEYGSTTASVSYTNQTWDGDQYRLLANNGPFVHVQDEYRVLQITSGAVEYEVRPWDCLGLVAGVGLHYLDKEESGGETDYSYFLGADLSLWEGGVIHANHARKVRFPSLRELYDGDSANAELTAEDTFHYELGVEQYFTFLDLNMGVTGFVITANNFIENDAVTNIRENFETYRMTGVESFVSLQPLEALHLQASYTYTEATNEGEDRTYDRLQNRPRNMFALQGRYAFPYDITLAASYSYVGDQVGHSGDANNPDLVVVDDAQIIDAKLSKEFWLTDEQFFELYVGADNLFDYDTELSAGRPAPGRNVYTGVEYHF